LGFLSGWSGSSGQDGGATDASNIPAAEVILKTGYLWKRGGHRGGRKSWRRRFFALKNENLHYYNPGNASLLGAMPMVGESSTGDPYVANVTRIDREEAETLGLPNNLTPYLFVVVTPDRSLYICASSAIQRSAWMDAILRVVGGHRERLEESF